MKRASGVLLPISALPGKYGIGSFGQAAYDFVDFLVHSRQSYWQILPLTTTSYGDSPYQSFSAFAGNTHFIDLDFLVHHHLLQEDDVFSMTQNHQPDDIDYARQFHERRPILEKAVHHFLNQADLSDFENFRAKQAYWLEDFALFMALKEAHDHRPFTQWEELLKNRDPEALDMARHQYQDTIQYHYVTQYFFAKQWINLKNYANERGIQIIGDLPIYVASDSVEMWATPDFFKVSESGEPTVVAGTPPDYFSQDGQYWGNPIYDWDLMAKEDYAWWVERLRHNFKLYDIVRIDHFRGFESYWEVPAEEETARNGHWVKGPGAELFQAVESQLGQLNIIAEDLGFLTDEVIAMREETGYPGMKVVQFGFNGDHDSMELPHHHIKNCVAYVGTHDNETAMGWYQDSATSEQQEQMRHYLNMHSDESPAQALNRSIAASVADTCIYTMQDILELGNYAQMNRPNTIGINWRWRLMEGQLTDSHQEYLRQLTECYFRVGE